MHLVVILVLLQSTQLGEFDVVLRQFTTGDGLSSNIVEVVVQDSLGFIWIGTQGGLERYDGYVFKSYSGVSESGFKGTYVRDIEFSPEGTMWVLCAEGYLNKYDPYLDKFVSFPILEPGTERLIGNAWHLYFTSAYQATIILIDRNPANIFQVVHMVLDSGNTWRELIPIDRKWVELLQRDPGFTQEIYPPETADDGSSWIPHRHGLLFKANGDSIYHQVSLPELPMNQTYSMRHLSLDGDSLLWISTLNHSVFCYDRRDGSLANHPFANSSDAWHYHYAYQTVQNPSDPHRLWVGTRSQGILELDKKTGIYRRLVSNIRIPSDTYVHLVDRSGVLWMSGRGAGLFAMNPTVSKTHRILTNETVGGQLTPIDVTDIQPDGQGRFLVATYTNGLYLLDSKGKILRHMSQVGPGFLPHHSIWSVDIDSDERLWIASSAGVAVSESDEWNFSRPEPEVTGYTSPWHQFSRSVRVDQNGTIWLGSANGLGRFDSVTKKWTAYAQDESDSTSIADNYIHTLFIDSKNTLWVGHAGGCVSERISDEPVRFRRHTNGQECRVYSFHERQDGTIWVGTSTGVFKIVRGSSQMEPVHELASVSNQRVNSFYDDKSGRVWMGTTQGLVIVDLVKNTNVKLLAIDGFHTDGFSYRLMEDQLGRIWASTFSGIIRFDDSSMSMANPMNGIHIVDARLLDSQGTSIPTVGGVRLSHKENSLLVAVSNFDYRDPASQQWYFRLNGLHEEWIPATNRNLMQYTSLDPGTYVLDVKVVSRYGYETSRDAALTVVVVPAYWQTVWFRLLVVLMVAVAIFMIAWTRYRKSVEVRETRERMLHDLHDDLSSVLASVQFNVNTLKPGGEIRPAALGRLEESARQAGDIMRDLLWTVNPKEDLWGNLVGRCKEFVAMSIDDHDIQLTWDVTGDESASVPLALKKQFMLVFKEIVTNCCKHSKARNVTFRMALGNVLHLIVQDDGVGFDTESHHKGVGMDSIRSRLTKAHAVWALTSAPGAGTRWEIRFPLR